VKGTQTKQKTEYDAVIRARCFDELKQRVLIYAARKGSDEAQIVRQAVIEFLERNEASTASSSSGKPVSPSPSSGPSGSQLHQQKPKVVSRIERDAERLLDVLKENKTQTGAPKRAPK
jgi:hypothetical protein